MKSVLAIGVDPALVDFSALPQLTPELVRSYIDAQIERLREAGFEVTSCLVDLGETAEVVAAEALQSTRFDCVVIGAGLRVPADRLLLFERIVNLVHQLAPNASICFNSKPSDTEEAVQRWILPSRWVADWRQGSQRQSWTIKLARAQPYQSSISTAYNADDV